MLEPSTFKSEQRERINDTRRSNFVLYLEKGDYQGAARVASHLPPTFVRQRASYKLDILKTLGKTDEIWNLADALGNGVVGYVTDVLHLERPEEPKRP